MQQERWAPQQQLQHSQNSGRTRLPAEFKFCVCMCSEGLPRTVVKPKALFSYDCDLPVSGIG